MIIISHGGYEGSCMGYDQVRHAICAAMGGSWPVTMEGGMWYWGDGYSKESHPGLYAILSTSDEDAKREPGTCKSIAEELWELLPLSPEVAKQYQWDVGHAILLIAEAAWRCWEMKETMTLT